MLRGTTLIPCSVRFSPLEGGAVAIARKEWSGSVSPRGALGAL
jgi:hypothetical protein